MTVLDNEGGAHHPQANGVENFPPIEKLSTKRMRRKQSKWTLIITFLSFIFIIILITVAYLVSKGLFVHEDAEKVPIVKSCQDDMTCRIEIVETLPKVLSYPSGSPMHASTPDVWKKLTKVARERIDILSFYWTLKNFTYDEAVVGAEILEGLKGAARRGIKVNIVQNAPTKQFPNLDTFELAKEENVEVRSMKPETLGGGVLHTKVWVVDKRHMYVGSANFDWRSLTEVKELGAALYNCTCAGEDLFKIFDVNWLLAQKDSQIPSPWPEQYQTTINKDHPQNIKLVDAPPLDYYWSTSPPSFCAPKRTSDIDAIIDLISRAEKFVYIAVMDYYAAFVYQNKRFWPTIDDALRSASFDRGIEVRLLTSKWPHTNAQQTAFIKSLNEFGKMPMPHTSGSITVKQFEMPPNEIPFARVNHNKYMVTDKGGFISTSNWSGDYFATTAGVSLIVNQTESPQNKNQDQKMQDQLKDLFMRDWKSQYTKGL
ncbi:5'-3' exonuclease PLD3-like [Clytia hemisphaerica]|uniref:PLD phosphodiesterase domain-containing protein n=1 Tax=Clytia hemisphaerica TaxID=252671 RepID=A0A7M5V275_9CNID|eukprot:TCONS_00061553-protein